MILIGSHALRARNPELINRESVDIDMIATETEFRDYLKTVGFGLKSDAEIYQEKPNPTVTKLIAREGSFIVECELITPGSTAEQFAQLVKEDSETFINNEGFLVPSLNKLFMLKASHRYLRNSPHFWKTAQDYHKMKSVGTKVDSPKFFRARERETYFYKHPSLKQNKENFFKDDLIEYIYDHDTIHKSVAIYDRPAYTYYMVEGAEVECDKTKFFALPLEIRLAGVIEEAAVLAIERSLVPHPGAKTPREAWFFALSKVCSSITSGWFREFAYNNLPTLVKLYPDGYWEQFNQRLEEGKVLPFTGSKYAKRS